MLHRFFYHLPTLLSRSSRFRYRVTLHAPTAMIKDQNETPVTYLNKGQIYRLSITDSVPPPADSQPAKYRTSIRIVFDEAAQRIAPLACWQLWKCVRGLKNAQERGSDLQAVDCLDPAEGKMGQSRNHIKLERMSVDGFCYTWAADIHTGICESSIGVRFNFLSTDFTHSKGIKGSSVRLCAKTEILASDVGDTGVGNTSEMCYCKVKLFRDHGAGRKLHSDITHTNKSITKLRRETAISEIETDNQLGKRKRGSISGITKSDASHVISDDEQRQAQIYRNAELQKLSDSLTSNLPITYFTRRANPKDDPDQSPIRLPVISQGPLESDYSLQSTDSTKAPSNITSANSSSPSTTIAEPSRVSSNTAPEQNSPQNVSRVPGLPAKSTDCSKIPHSESGRPTQITHRRTTNHPASLLYADKLLL